MQGLRPRPTCGSASEILFGIFRFHQHWKHNRRVIDSEEDSSDEATPDYFHRRNPARPILPSSGPSNTSAISLRAGPWTLQSQQSHLHVSSPALYYLPAGSPLRLADQARNQRGTSLLAEVRETRPVSQRTLPDSNILSQDSVIVRVSPISQDSLPPPTIACDRPRHQRSPRSPPIPSRPESDRGSRWNRQPPLRHMDQTDARATLSTSTPIFVCRRTRRLTATPTSNTICDSVARSLAHTDHRVPASAIGPSSGTINLHLRQVRPGKQRPRGINGPVHTILVLSYSRSLGRILRQHAGAD